MVVEIGVVRGGSIKSVLSQQYNIYLGVSLNNRWFTQENMRKSIIWGLAHTKERFGIVIVDTLQAINYEVRDKYSPQASLRKALKEGDKFVWVINKILEELSTQERAKVDIIRWEIMKEDIFYKIAFPIFLKEFEKNIQFKNKIKEIIREFTTRAGKPDIEDQKIERLCMYVIGELPELTNGFSFNGVKYNCIIYPFDGPVTRLVENIQKKEEFVELHKQLEMGDNIFVELR